jgi:hypothetical protein
MAFTLSVGGSFSVSTQQRINDLPLVGAASRSFDVTIATSLPSAGAIRDSVATRSR